MARELKTERKKKGLGWWLAERLKW
jgi:hypothetical protein